MYVLYHDFQRRFFRMKINANYDKKTIRVEAEIPPEEFREFFDTIRNFIVSLFAEEKKVDGPKKGHPKKGGGS